MQTLRKKSSPCKYRNDPGRFFGDGVIFKAKLIGILEVGEARGDRMCQEALQDLKMAIRAAGEHKQRITIHVTLDGLRLRDEKTGDSLYHHPVHKISFIAQDMTDSRAFGYIFGSPDSGHRFFGIKTDKAASQVVLAMRDLFQVVFELKKKEIEMARQQIQSKTIHEHQPIPLNIKNSSAEASGGLTYGKSSNEASKTINIKEMSPESVADLVDLEQELSSIQRGITQMERITPNEPTAGTKNLSQEEDPFGDSFTIFPTYNLLPPPESSRSRHSKPLKPPETTAVASSNTSNPNITTQSQNKSIPPNEIPLSSYNSPQSLAGIMHSGLGNGSSLSTAATISTSDNWRESDGVVSKIPYESQQQPNVENSTNSTTATTGPGSLTEEIIPAQLTGEEISKDTNQITPANSNSNKTLTRTNTQNQYTDAFTDLDPLGTGKSKPYIDKKYFFQDLKNPPKKVLKDLSGLQDGIFSATFTGTMSVDQCGGNKEKADVLDKKFIESFESTEPIARIEYTSKLSTSSHQQQSQSTSSTSSNLERSRLEDMPPPLASRDTDPFSPTRKKSDPFQEGDIFSKLDPFEFEFSATSETTKDEILPDTKIINDDSTRKKDVFNGPLQVSLPPDSWSASMAQQMKIERQNSESPTSTARNRPSGMFKQNTVDVISSISSKKMPHLFGQKFSKRDSNSINMRRLQESDSLSENETAPEPPPRPDTISNIEPPPLPPKKQFSDIVIRPRITSSSAIPPPTRYEYVTAKMKQNQSLDSAPPIPLPSRKVGRIDSSFPGPGRPGRKPGEEEDYLTPMPPTARSGVPPLLPPPQPTRNRGRRIEHYDQKAEHESPRIQSQTETKIPDITLTQLLTLGIDELALKLNVPTSKLNTMTLVELTIYLNDFIENTKNSPKPPKKQNQKPEYAVFKVNFDQNSDATFIAKFDDNFGEESSPTPFVANFSQFEAKSESQTVPNTVPSADRYAVFREIIEQEQQFSEENIFGEDGELGEEHGSKEQDSDSPETTEEPTSSAIPIAKIDTKITEAISHAKDRYAALRDIILVEDLFEKSSQTRPPTESLSNPDLMEEIPTDEDGNVFEEVIDNDVNLNDDNDASSPEAQNQIFPIDALESNANTTRQTPEIRQNGNPLNKDDFEIDELMNRAISNLSLNSRDNLSPNVAGPSKSPQSCASAISLNGGTAQNASTSPINTLQPINNHHQKSQFNDMSTSPIPLQKSPIPQHKSPLAIKSPQSKSPIPAKSPQPPQSPAVMSLIDASKGVNSGSLSDVICGSSPEGDSNAPEPQKQSTTPSAAGESWAIFDQPPQVEKKPMKTLKSPKLSSKELAESPCSSDGKDEWNKSNPEYGRRWPKGQTSSSSRDLSPWDDDAPDLRKRQPPPGSADRHGYYMRHARRMNSCDDDYEYEEDMTKRRERRMKSAISRSRENFDSDSQNWYHPSNHHNWSPQDDDTETRTRPFERSVYERSTYGPPYDKREHKIPPGMLYDRRSYKGYDKRKYYREYARAAEYNFEPYGDSPDVKERKLAYYGDGFEKPKCRRDYENIYQDEFGGRSIGHKGRGGVEYFYERDRKSFDRESNESYESAGRTRHKSFGGSGDLYGSLESREDFRERYMSGSGEKSRSLRKGTKMRDAEEYEQDSENDVQLRRGVAVVAGSGEARSLQRPMQSARIRKSSGSSPWDGEEAPPNAPTLQKSWKRPSSASESERRLAESLRCFSNTMSGSDGEKDRRFRKKPRSRSVKEIDIRPQTFGSMRYPSVNRRDLDPNYDYIDYDDYEQPPPPPPPPPPIDDGNFEKLNRRRQEMHQRMLESSERRKKATAVSCNKFNFEPDGEIPPHPKQLISKKDSSYYNEKDRYAAAHHAATFEAFEDTTTPKSSKSLRREFDFDDFEETPRSNTSSGQFKFEEHGFESDFNSPPASAATTQPPSTNPTPNVTTNKSSFRFSNDFSEKHERQTLPTSSNTFDSAPELISHQTTPTQKIRFDENVIVSKFESDSSAAGAFEDDFSKAEFLFENEDQWQTELPKKNNLRLSKRQENIKKSESVNIFAKKVQDPFEDDDFFKSESPTNENGGRENKRNPNKTMGNGGNNNTATEGQFQWDSNFAKFDENM